MDFESIVGTLIAIIIAGFTYKGLSDEKFQDHYMFDVDKILIEKQYYRLFSSGFLHANWLHFGFNIIALISFATVIETELGVLSLLLIYFSSLLGGSLLSLYIHRNHGDYTAVGASGAISGIVAACILLFPKGEISLILIPFGITSWIFGSIFVLISLFGIKSQNDNIGHEAHLGGTIVGLCITFILAPKIALENWWVAALYLIPIGLFLVLTIKRPDILITGKWNMSNKNSKSKTKKSKREKSEISLDQILDKIAKKGMGSLSEKEKRLLEKYSDKL